MTEKAVEIMLEKASELPEYSETTRPNTYFKSGFRLGYHQAEKDVLDVIEKELTRRMLEDYNEGVEEDDIAQGCMASLIMFVRQMKEE